MKQVWPVGHAHIQVKELFKIRGSQLMLTSLSGDSGAVVGEQLNLKKAS